jgi:hypothetical protein
MTITQLIQNSPAKANELFSKLADTSEGALKTREKLFSELKDELETLASLEERFCQISGQLAGRGVDR